MAIANVGTLMVLGMDGVEGGGAAVTARAYDFCEGGVAVVVVVVVGVEEESDAVDLMTGAAALLR